MQQSFEYGARTIDFDVTYSRRKTLKITVEPPNIISVVAPSGLSRRMVIERVRSKAAWIAGKLTCFDDLHLPPDRSFVSGESFMYLGRDYPLSIYLNAQLKKPVASLRGERVWVETPAADPNAVRGALEAWYRQQALEKIGERVRYYQQQFLKCPSAIRVKEQKQRWGSCTGRDALLFNWRCIMAPLEVLDYVVVHEMCHLEHKNHSQQFWDLLISILPDFRQRKNWLRNNGIRMVYNL
ncbi:MAG: SprT family zinc-dependent metalloprotease [Thermacetogeniaceae bacterium]